MTFFNSLLFSPQTVQQQLLSKTIADQAAVEGNEEEKEVIEERSRQLKRRYFLHNGAPCFLSRVYNASMGMT